ncbi:hypothetical protein DH2020_022846 [Rehmannia glutinosa]|uniref:Cyclin C-terminal domain-containing protein n=1 Tax=Rehmannia glutinosa TaxID=99300 RepID=A0ABR0W4B2_REHGL
MEFHFDLQNPLSTSIINIPLLFHTETHQMLSKTYLQNLNVTDSNPSTTRRHILSLILYFCRNFDPFSSYLAVNYMDRFISTHSIPNGKPWIFKLVAVSCVSLALKMRKTEFSVSDFQDGDDSIIFNSVAIERTDMLIIGALKWRMRSVNPFCFISFFISFFKLKDQTSTQALRDRAIEIILRAQNDIKLLDFKPSIISASALVAAVQELFPVQLPCFINSVSSCGHVNKENLFKCYSLLPGVVAMAESALDMTSSSCTPDNVLDLLQCFSSSTSENKPISETSENKDGEINRALKRRKFGDFATNT